jgi:hypothetical protein
MAPTATHPDLQALAAELTQYLGIPFEETHRATIGFRHLRLTDWAVPMIFDGHVQREGEGLVPVDFVAHALWPHLHCGLRVRGRRPWWSCELGPAVAVALLEALREDDLPADDAWPVDAFLAAPRPEAELEVDPRPRPRPQPEPEPEAMPEVA